MDKQSPKAAGKAPCAMNVQVANNIIAEHMKKAGFEYSLSVFLPEAGLNVDKVHNNITLNIKYILVPHSLYEKSGIVLRLASNFLSCSRLKIYFTF